MIIVYLVFGMLIGATAATMTLLNGGSILLALLAYSSGGAFAVLAPLFAAALVGLLRDTAKSWGASSEAEGPISA